MHFYISRLVMTLVSIGVLGVLARGIPLVQRWRVNRRHPAAGLGDLPISPLLLYFSSASCAQCGPQEREIERMSTALRDKGQSLRVQKVNALMEEELVKAMNVITVPTTVLLDRQGNVKAWNPGLTRWKTLVEQCDTVR
jgi:hypothetical protein